MFLILPMDAIRIWPFLVMHSSEKANLLLGKVCAKQVMVLCSTEFPY